MSTEETTIFSSEDLLTEPVTEPVVETDDQFLENLVGEGKKYTTHAELAKAYAHAETFIETLKVEKKGVETELEQAKLQATNVEEIMNKLNTGEEPPKPNEDDEPTALTPAQIQELVASTISEADAANQHTVAVAAKKTEVWTKLAEEIGTIEDAKAAAKAYVGDNPSRVKVLDQLALTDVDTLVKILKPLAPEHNPDSHAEQHSSAVTRRMEIPSGLTWSKCQKMRKENKDYYNSREFQAMMHRAADETENFFNK